MSIWNIKLKTISSMVLKLQTRNPSDS